ncbi:TauD/TfdA family dioxygenase [Actinoallomurus sp. NBC_01490]|uniref:TauD/TfdA family dioxygenase n=1 Tax=Actinoallomurus sp. NBC_01490 TaxID=2903557 RepID=UPI002E34051F|nr:TauD/TfdA family dioxygenase [Actinoallomurus sp. NBC_01490]
MVTTLTEHERSELSEVASTATGWALDQATLEALRRATGRSEALKNLASRVLREVNDHGYCLVHDVPTRSDEELATFLGLVSTLSNEGNGGELFFTISPTAGEGEVADVSRTGAPFPFHSDSTYMIHPHEMLGLGCVVNDSGGGDSSLIRAADIAAQVESKAGHEALLALQDPVFPFFLRDPVVGYGVQKVPLLRRVADEWHVRYRSDVLEALLPKYELDERHGRALRIFQSVLADPLDDVEIIIRLQPRDYLLIDNRRALHARTALGKGARELRRSKGYFLNSRYHTII